MSELATVALGHCQNLPTFKITATAALYSELAGILAGFAFTALMLLATTQAREGARGSEFSDAMRILVAAFLSLLLVSVNYAVLAGDPGTDGRTASEEPIVGVGFATAGILVIYAITSTLRAAGQLLANPSPASDDVETSTRHVLAAAFAPILVLYVYLAVQDYEDFRYGPCHGLTSLDALGWALVLIQILASWVGYPILYTLSSHGRLRRFPAGSASWIGRSLLTVTFSSTVVYGLVDSYLPPSGTLPPAAPVICLLTFSLAMLGLVWHLGITAGIRKYSKSGDIDKTLSQERQSPVHVPAQADGTEPPSERSIDSTPGHDQ
jgi:hypothetical protein